MKTAWSVLIGDGRGKIGTVAATLTRSGPVLRNLFRQKQSATFLQLQMRAALGTLSQLWRSTSMAPYRAAWILLAIAHPELDVFTNPIKKTGLQWFNRCNRNRQTFGLDPVLAAPAWASVGNPGSLSLTRDAGSPDDLTVHASTPPAAGEAVVILATRGLSPGILALSNQQKIIFTQNPGSGSSWIVTAEYTAKFGAPIDGLQLFAQVHYVNIAQGRAGIDSQAGLIW